MKILMIGNGGREHALIWKMAKSPLVTKIYAAPGNGGTAQIAENVDIPVDDLEGLLGFAREKQIDMTVVGPELPLVLGITDLFESNGFRVFGPNKACAQLEGSKAFAKEFMFRHNIPTAKYEEYTSVDEAKKNVSKFGYPTVIKADGLAAGKGVLIPQNEQEAFQALDELMVNSKFGIAGDKIIIEEFLQGIEASVLCFVDGDTILPMESAQDYKKVFDGDQGPNTGGMGTYSPSLLFDEAMDKKVDEEVLQPFLEGLKKDGLDFKGIIFIGLMIDGGELKVLEFNVRFGDPETQSVMLRLESDLVEVFDKIIDRKLNEVELKWSDDRAVCIIMASGGYPDSYEKGKAIEGLEDDVLVFHSGTLLKNDVYLSNGGRVLGIMGKGETLDAARKMAYDNAKKISFEKSFYRNDIGLLIK